MPRGDYQVTVAKSPRPSIYSLDDSSVAEPEEEVKAEQGADSVPGDASPREAGPKLTPLERLTKRMCSDEKTTKELVTGRRVGFYKLHGEIGCGSFSRVKLACHALTKDKVAIKVLEKTRLDVQTNRLMAREIASMESLQHPNVLRLYEVLETHSRLHLVLEFAGGGDLHTRISNEGKMSDNQSKIAFGQILSAIKHMHENNIIHRDLKAENVLFTCSSCIKVADFGFSTRVPNHDVSLDTFCGSPPYAAPELFKDENYKGPLVDIWAMGVLLFFMVTGTMPFKAETIGKLRLSVLAGAFTVPPWVPGPCQRLIKGIMKPLPQDRYAVDQMLGCDWLLPVEFPWSVVPPVPPSPLRLLEEEELEEEEEEVKAIMEELGVTLEHIRNNQTRGCRSPITGIYRILLHNAQKRRGSETLPVVRGVVRDHRREGLKAYRGLRHTSKFCVLS